MVMTMRHDQKSYLLLYQPPLIRRTDFAKRKLHSAIIGIPPIKTNSPVSKSISRSEWLQLVVPW